MDRRPEIVETLVEESVDLAQTPPGTVAASKTKVKVCCVKEYSVMGKGLGLLPNRAPLRLGQETFGER